MDNLANTSLFLGKFIGVCLATWAVFLMFQTKECMVIAGNLYKNPKVLKIIAIAILVAGLVLVIIHPVWVLGWQVIITIMGWSLVLSSLVYLFFPYKAIVLLIEYFNRPISYIIHGVLSLAAGLYLIVMSFGLI